MNRVKDSWRIEYTSADGSLGIAFVKAQTEEGARDEFARQHAGATIATVTPDLRDPTSPLIP